MLRQSYRTLRDTLEKLSVFGQDRFENKKDNGKGYFLQRDIVVMKGMENKHALRFTVHTQAPS